MASNKTRSKNDTWTPEELRMALKEEDAAGKKSHREKSSSRKTTKDIDEKDKEIKKSQDIASRRRLLREEEEEEARKLKARKAKKAEQNTRSHALMDEEEQRRKRREQKAKEGNVPDKDEEERRRRRHERKLKEGNLTEDKDEEERRRRRHERKLKEANQADKDEEERRRKRREQRTKEHNIIDKEEEQRQKRHERKGKDEKLLADLKDEEERRRRRHERKLKEANQIEEDEEERRRRKREQKTKEGSALNKDEEERRRRHEKKRGGKGTEGDDEERRRQRHERKVKGETKEDEEENERRRQRRHEKRSKDGNVADVNEEEQRRRRHERKLKEGKIAEEDDEERRQRKREQKAKEKKQGYEDAEERYQKKEQHKKKSDKTIHQDNKMNVSRQEIKSSGDKNLDNLKNSKKSKHEEVNYKNEKQEQMAKGDIKESYLQSAQDISKLETEVNSKSRDAALTIQDEYNYEDDDFEDYSDDFDDDSLPGNNSNQENAFQEDMKENMEYSYLSSADSRSRDSVHVSSAEKSSSSMSERPAYQVMDFSHAKMRKMTQKNKSKLQSRSDDLCSLIALDVAVGQEIFELAPISEYELYIRNFGKANSSQAYVQTGDDNIDRDIQTEEIGYLDKWTQHPPNGPVACGGNSDQNFIQTDFADKSQLHDSARLNKFLLQATQVISILLEENHSSDTYNLAHEKSSQLPFSKSFFTLSSCPLFQEHKIDCCTFASSRHTENLLTVHNPSVTTIKEKNGKKTKSLGSSYIALWDLRTPSRPNQILCSESAISCCFGSLQSQLVLAGCVDGAVVVWDLRESESLHKHISFEDIEYHVCYPAYNTAGVLSFNSHCNTIQTIRDIPLLVGREIETSIQKERFSSQLLSMDQSGLVNLWVIVELSSVDSSGSTVDLGLSPGSRIKLEHTSSINVHAAVRDSLFPTSIRTQQLCLLPNDPNQIYIATDTGHIIHSVRLGSQPYPRVHCPRKVTLSSVLSHVLSLDFSPFMVPCFLTGHSDGSVNLYHTSLECPVVTWLPSQTGTESIVCVRWSQSRPTVFYALNDSSTLFAFDLLEQDNSAVCTQIYEDRLTSFNIICNSNADTKKLESTEKMALCFADSHIEVHTISEVFSQCQTLELEYLETYLHRC